MIVEEVEVGAVERKMMMMMMTGVAAGTGSGSLVRESDW